MIGLREEQMRGLSLYLSGPSLYLAGALASSLLTACAAAPAPIHRGIYDAPPEAYAELAADGFTLVVGGHGGLDEALAHGLKRIPWAVEGLPGPDHPAAAGWYLFDEPDLNGKTPEEVRDAYARFKRAGARAFMTVWDGVRYREFFDFCDILGPDPYPIRSKEPTDDLSRVGERVDLARALSRGRPVWAVLQCFVWEPHFPRLPTEEEMRCMAFQAVAKGAGAVIWFDYKNLYASPPHREAVRRINREIAEWGRRPDAAPVSWSGEGAVLTASRRGMTIVVNAERRERTGKLNGRPMTLKPLETLFVEP
jgi:hypothetical protein